MLEAPSAYDGGYTGLLVTSGITIEGNGSTITRKSDAPEFRIAAVGPEGNLTLQKTTVSGGVAHSGPFTRGGGGLLNFGTLTLTDSGLASILDPTLADNGGPTKTTKTHALVAGSPAIDFVPKADCATTPDQRGVVRPQGGDCDIGAFELGGSPPTEANLSLTKTDSPDPVTAGGDLTYRINVTNNGPSNATGVTVTDPLPGGVTLVSATPSRGTCNETATVPCGLGSLANGASATVTIVVTPTSAGTLNNTASVTGSPADPNLGNNSDPETTTVNAAPSANLALTKTDSPDPVTVGGNLTYRITSPTTARATRRVSRSRMTCLRRSY